MAQPIGYYVHHQGRGHLARATAIASLQPERFVLLGAMRKAQSGALATLDLPCDLPDAATYFDAYASHPGCLHYAPLGNAGLRQRMAALAGWIGQAKPALMVCDVSVEVAMLARLMATPVAYVRLNGNRNDPAHLEAFQSAASLLAPFHPALDDPETPDWVRRKTAYFPGIISLKPAPAAAKNIILVVNGAGGEALDGNAIAAAARAMPAFQWRGIGDISAPERPPENLKIRGWVADAASEIANATVIVGAAGDGLVSAVLAAARPFLCLPQPRPFDEQHAKAARLQALGAAITLPAWPEPGAWPALIDRAMALNPACLSALHDPDGARKACDFLTGAMPCLG